MTLEVGPPGAGSWTGGLVAALLGAGGLWGLLKALALARTHTVVAKIREPADLLTAMAAFQGAVTKTAEGMMSDLRDEVKDLREQGARDRAEIEELKAENVECRRENGELQARVSGLEAAWQRSHVTAPGVGEPGSFTVIDGDRVTVMTPQEKIG